MLSNADIAAIVKIKRLSAVTLNMAAAKLRLLKDCSSISSGTLASLTKTKNYEILDAIHGDFIVFVQILLPRRNWTTWLDAWRDFWDIYGEIGT